MAQLTEQPDREKMFHENYAFFSSTSEYMKLHFKDFANSIIKMQSLTKDSFVVEIGCNDGIMIQNFKNQDIGHLGVEPSKNVAAVAKEKGVNVVSEFFDVALAKQIISEYKKADAILSANVMCHIPYMHSVFEGIKELLKEDGVFIFEDPYLGDIVEKNSFDQIYDEHVFYFSAMSVGRLAQMHDLELVDTIKQSTHGGSMRYVIAHKGAKEVLQSVKSTIENEISLGLDNKKTFENFASNVANIKKDLYAILSDLKAKNKKVVAYGATSKSTTVTNYCNITPDLLEFVSDTTPIKQNKLTPGAHIPVLPYEEFKKASPDFVLLFAWNHAKEIMSKEAEFMQSIGAKWIVYVPKVEILNP
jgi:methylation protein EvaC